MSKHVKVGRPREISYIKIIIFCSILLRNNCHDPRTEFMKTPMSKTKNKKSIMTIVSGTMAVVTIQLNQTRISDAESGADARKWEGTCW